jgi:L-aminopeptidase/D-esterase-like protein
MGIARTGATSGNGSGDIFVAFSTANAGAGKARSASEVRVLPNDSMNGLFDATVEATEEAIVNAMVAATNMTGRDGNRSYARPHDRLREVMQKYNRMNRTRAGNLTAGNH